MLKEKALTLVVVNFVFFPIAAISLAMRVYVLFALTISMSTVAAYHGVGVHHYGATAAQMRDGVMYFSFWQIFFITSTVPIKASICISLLRITTNKVNRIILWTLIVLSSIAALISNVVVWSTCRPMAFTWDKTIKGGKCSSIDIILALSYLVSGSNIITDWTCAILPAFILYDIQMRTKLKISICLVLGMGAVASTATLIRLKFIPNYKNANDYLYGLADIAIWSVVEIGLGIIAGSIATLKPLFNKIFGSSKDPSPYTNDHTPRPFPGSYRLRDVSKGGLETTVRGGERSDISDEDTASQRRMLRSVAIEGHHPEGHSPPRQNLEGIKVTYDISVSNDRDDKKERKVEEMI
ncbi:uncharacterized protein BDZ99DRAFT_385536 [Mytilinidion resinicola]|uniref:Rhodopsin domain-containing protein n=1 Tax=Mytilinidion resinicola TaxID=574789 RepID=A0A6A6YT86_9PEZI|nr:uncharacterized protein BDZ99DRAFT_385536 [Mytilinidion resinicola]KAF2811244.1 hypothetical protein BDZ99DRAFT_385536 [Mytilinidion resinicola]